jgi:hypothetical protein
MWALPLIAAAVSLLFAVLLARQFVRRRRPHQAVWAVALLMYAGASLALFLGALSGWTAAEYRTYWLLGAVLNVPFLAQGELDLLIGDRRVTTLLLVVLLFGTAYAAVTVLSADIAGAALREDLPSGREAFGDGSGALLLARLYSFPAYFVLVGGTLWSAWRMRGRPGLRDRFLGTLLIAVGATVVAAGAAFAAAGNLPGFSITLAAGVGLMFWGFLRASIPTRPPVGLSRSAHPSG